MRSTPKETSARSTRSKGHRLAATARHLSDPETLVYFLTMEGLLFEVDVDSLAAKRLANLVEELKIPDGAQPHFKAAHTAQGRLVVANNTYEEAEYLGQRAAGRLAEWDGKTWTVLEENPFIEVSGKQNPTPGAALRQHALRRSAGTAARSSSACCTTRSGRAIACRKAATPGTTLGTPNGCGFAKPKPNAT